MTAEPRAQWGRRRGGATRPKRRACNSGERDHADDGDGNRAGSFARRLRVCRRDVRGQRGDRCEHLHRHRRDGGRLRLPWQGRRQRREPRSAGGRRQRGKAGLGHGRERQSGNGRKRRKRAQRRRGERGERREPLGRNRRRRGDRLGESLGPRIEQLELVQLDLARGNGRDAAARDMRNRLHELRRGRDRVATLACQIGRGIRARREQGVPRRRGRNEADCGPHRRLQDSSFAHLVVSSPPCLPSSRASSCDAPCARDSHPHSGGGATFFDLEEKNEGTNDVEIGTSQNEEAVHARSRRGRSVIDGSRVAHDLEVGVLRFRERARVVRVRHHADVEDVLPLASGPKSARR